MHWGDHSISSGDNLKPLRVINLGLKPYREVWKIQQGIQQELIKGTGEPTLILCEHPAVLTLGRAAKRENILASPEELKNQGVEVIEIERGGDVTLHCPGQLVGYVLVDLTPLRRDVGWFMRSLEEVAIRSIEAYDLKGQRIEGKTGVWLDIEKEARKIASIGVRISRWCSLHGFALNVSNSLDLFSLIHPCGIREVSMTSVSKEAIGAEVRNEDLIQSIPSICAEVLGFTDLAQ